MAWRNVDAGRSKRPLTSSMALASVSHLPLIIWPMKRPRLLLLVARKGVPGDHGAVDDPVQLFPVRPVACEQRQAADDPDIEPSQRFDIGAGADLALGLAAAEALRSEEHT